MAIITNYGTLKTAVADMIAREDLTSYIPNWIQAAEALIYRECKIRQMEATTSGLTATGQFAVPSGANATYVGLKEVFVSDVSVLTPLERVSFQELVRQYPERSAGAASAEKPKVIARQGALFDFGPFPDTDYSIIMYYYARPDAMSADIDAPWPVTDAPDLILYGSLLQSAPFLREDPRLQVWELLYQQAKASLLEDYAAELTSGARSQERRIA